MQPAGLPDTTTNDALPLWMTALQASGCRAARHGVDRIIDWKFVSGRAVYTNRSAGIEVILPFGVPLERGATLVVSWPPGERAYLLELHRHGRLAA